MGEPSMGLSILVALIGGILIGAGLVRSRRPRPQEHRDAVLLDFAAEWYKGADFYDRQFPGRTVLKVVLPGDFIVNGDLRGTLAKAHEEAERRRRAAVEDALGGAQ